MLKCPTCGIVGNYHAEDEDELGNTWYECDDCGDQFIESDAEYIEEAEV